MLDRFPLPIPLPPPQAVLALIRKLVLLLPVVIAPRILELLDDVLDPRTPAWRRALIASLILELLALVQIQVPAAAALRCLLLGSLFAADKRAREKAEQEERLQAY